MLDSNFNGDQLKPQITTATYPCQAAFCPGGCCLCIRAGTLIAMRGGTADDRGVLISSLDLAHKFGEKELGYHFPRLENTRLEVEAVGKLFPDHTLFLGPDASEGKVKSSPLDQYRYTLFSTHGILGNDIPYIKEPALVLNLVGNKLCALGG